MKLIAQGYKGALQDLSFLAPSPIHRLVDHRQQLVSIKYLATTKKRS